MEQIRKKILERLEDLKEKIEENTPCPENEQDLELLIEIDDRLEECLGAWYY
jgi:hypothetical protein